MSVCVIGIKRQAALGFLLQIPCATLHEVIDALVEKTAGTLQPFLLEEPYEENISEATVQHARIHRTLHLLKGCPDKKNPVFLISIRFCQR